MSNYRIIYPNDTGGIAVIVPAPGISQSEAVKAVPTDKPHLVVDAADIPTDRTFRDAWTADFSSVLSPETPSEEVDDVVADPISDPEQEQQ